MESLLAVVRRTAGRNRASIAVLASALLAVWAWRHRLWLKYQKEVWAIQLTALIAEGAWASGPADWARFQYHVWKLLQLEFARRLEEGQVGLRALSPGVPHVDTGMKMKMKMPKVRVRCQYLLLSTTHAPVLFQVLVRITRVSCRRWAQTSS